MDDHGQTRQVMNRIYISYRTSDSQIVHHIYERAIQTHGYDNVVIHPEDSLPLHMPITTWVDSLINGCHYILIVIGPDWTGLDQFGRYKLSEGDVIYMETRYALQSRRKVLPVLVNGVTTLPPADRLPPDLVGLTDLQPIILHPVSFKADLDRLIAAPTTLQRLRYLSSLRWLNNLLKDPSQP